MTRSLTSKLFTFTLLAGSLTSVAFAEGRKPIDYLGDTPVIVDAAPGEKNATKYKLNGAETWAAMRAGIVDTSSWPFSVSMKDLKLVPISGALKFKDGRSIGRTALVPKNPLPESNHHVVAPTGTSTARDPYAAALRRQLRR